MEGSIWQSSLMDNSRITLIFLFPTVNTLAPRNLSFCELTDQITLLIHLLLKYTST
jgi:hypothetical protein